MRISVSPGELHTICLLTEQDLFHRGFWILYAVPGATSMNSTPVTSTIVPVGAIHLVSFLLRFDG